MDNMSVSEAAAEIGCTPNAVHQLIHKELIPVEKVGKKIFIDKNIVRTVVDLREQHGRRWAAHAPWNNGEDATPVADDVPAGLNAEILKLSRKFRQSGHPDIALKLADILFDQYEF